MREPLHSVRPARKKGFRTPKLSIASCEIELLEPAVTLFGGNIQAKKTKRAEHHSPAFEWRLYGDRVIEALTLLRPYMKSPMKVARAAMLINDYKLVTVRNGKYSPEQRERKEQFEREFLQLTRSVLTQGGYHAYVKPA